MRHFIVKDENGQIVGPKYKQTTEPNVADELSVIEVDDVRDYDVDYWLNG